MEDTKFRRTEAGALVSTDREGLKAYKLKKKRQADINKAIEGQQELREELAEIKGMLATLLGRLG